MLPSRTLTTQTMALALGLLLGLGASVQAVWAADDGNTLLRGRAVKDGMLGGPVDQGAAGGPSLSRTDISGGKRGSGDHDGVMNQLLDAPHGAIKEATIPGISKRKFGLNAEAEDFNGQSMNGSPDSAGGQMGNGIPDHAAAFKPGIPSIGAMPGEPVDDGMIMEGMPQTSSVGTGGAQDPDNTPEMQLAWEIWHKRVAETVFQRWNSVATSMFGNCPPLRAGLTYVVTRDGHVKDLRIVKSPDLMFNNISIQAIKSLDGDIALLQFPEGSRRMMVSKQAAFSKNAGDPANSMRYTTGDRETIRLR